ncbi:MAG: hemolysin III family protein [Bacteroidales bacterium]|jgi:hemolysin III|nr:hemolysin III family protein [Bacteroidales bacterium]MBO7379979.1 hemolysin III family protein [Bacteroidales bacterium]MBP5214543.1 hemolysin III family protein [Bacteroidales bacterium]MBP5765032.1 hemolysin III family protein [Bacteroidales bacterium]
MVKRSKSEYFSAITHTVGLALVPCIAWVIIWLGYTKNWEMAFGATFFTVGMSLMYLTSCFYHWTRAGASRKRILRILDHCSIYVLIASSYTPICMGIIEDDHFAIGWTAFGIIWALSLTGIFLKIFLFDRLAKTSLILYLILGWSILFFIPSVRECINLWAIIWIMLEGVVYTTGVYFFVHDREPNHPYYHGIWHIHVIAGTVLHWAAVFSMTLAPSVG